MEKQPTFVDRVLDEPKQLIQVSLTAASAALVLMLITGWVDKAKVFEIVLQFLLVVVLGAGIAYFYRRAEADRVRDDKKVDREREGRKARREALEEFHRSLVKQYHD